MERFCTNCGQPLEEGALFCPECGERMPLPGEDLPEAGSQALEERPEPAAALYAGAATAADAPAAPAPKKPVAPTASVHEGPEMVTAHNKPLSASTYFWTLFVFGLPGIGLLTMLIMAFTAKNANRRNLAQACLVGLLIILILLGLVMLVLVVSGKSFGVDLSKFSLEAIWKGILTGIGFTR